MASYNIPESVIGVPLFVPSTNDFFSLNNGGMPNGDDCLIIHGDVSRDYKAYVAAQTVSPNLFLSRSAAFSMSFWVYVSNITHAAGYLNSQTLFSVSTAAANSIQGWADSSTYEGSASATRHTQVWAVTSQHASTGSFCRLGFTRVVSAENGGNGAVGGAGYGSQHLVSGALTPNAWNFVVINVSAGTTNGSLATAPQMFVNNGSAIAGAIAGAGNGAPANGFVPVASSQFFCIGAYSDQSNMNGRDGEWKMGKLCFHDHLLNSTERGLLYYEMVGP